jgi:hypothetical protein
LPDRRRAPLRGRTSYPITAKTPLEGPYCEKDRHPPTADPATGVLRRRPAAGHSAGNWIQKSQRAFGKKLQGFSCGRDTRTPHFTRISSIVMSECLAGMSSQSATEELEKNRRRSARAIPVYACLLLAAAGGLWIASRMVTVPLWITVIVLGVTAFTLLGDICNYVYCGRRLRVLRERGHR